MAGETVRVRVQFLGTSRQYGSDTRAQGLGAGMRDSSLPGLRRLSAPSYPQAIHSLLTGVRGVLPLVFLDCKAKMFHMELIEAGT